MGCTALVLTVGLLTTSAVQAQTNYKTDWERFSDAEFDQLEAAAKAETDVEKRSGMYQRMQDIMEDSGAYRFLTHEGTPVIYSNSIKPAFRPDGLPLLRFFMPA